MSNQMEMTLEQFKAIALKVLKYQNFGYYNLFDADSLEDYQIQDERGSMCFDEYLNDFYEELKNESDN